ncbi:DUF4149 domain-containing protein [Massilia sp. W12]|uniref:DUF4149 domain-containing protein n=1 Tax=Massilia sp. W12 TaxID=3126507 RepID=UPI0030CB0EDB
MSNTSEIPRINPWAQLRMQLAALWLGSFLTIGLLAAPALFEHLPRQSAGKVAGAFFASQAVVSLVSGLLLAGLLCLEPALRRARAIWCLLGAALLLQALNHLGLRPEIGALRDAINQQEALLKAMQGNADLLQEMRQRFGLLHGVSSGIWLLQAAAIAALCWRLR